MIPNEIQLLNKDEEMSRFNHGNIILYIAYHLNYFLESNNLGEIADDLDVQLLITDKRVRPDLTFISHPHLQNIKQGIYHGAPDVVMEVVSPASFMEDQETKKLLYALEGIPEYWIIFPESQAVYVYQLIDEKYRIHTHAVEKGIVTSKVITNFEVEISKIFKGIRIG